MKQNLTIYFFIELENVDETKTIQEEIDETNVFKENEDQSNDEIDFDCPVSESSKSQDNETDLDEVSMQQSASTPRVDAQGCSDDYDALTDIDNVPLPDINSEEEPCPSDKPIYDVKEETNIPHEQRSPIVRRKNERTKTKPFTNRTLCHQNTHSDGEYQEEEDAENYKYHNERYHNQTTVRTNKKRHGPATALEVHDDSYIHPVKKRSIRYSRKKLDPNYDGTVGVKGMHMQDVLSDGEYDETSSVDLRYPPSTLDKMKKSRNYHEIQKSGTPPLQTIDLKQKQKSPRAQFIEDDQYTPSKQIHNHRSQHTESRKLYFQGFEHDRGLKTEKEASSDEDQKYHNSQNLSGSTEYEVHKKRNSCSTQDELLPSDHTPANASNAKIPSHTLKHMRNKREDKSDEEYKHDAVLNNRKVETSYYDDKQHVSYQQTPNQKMPKEKKGWENMHHNQDLKGYYPPATENFGDEKDSLFNSDTRRYPKGAVPFQQDISHDDHATYGRIAHKYQRDQLAPSPHYMKIKKHQANQRYYDDEDSYTDEDYEYYYMERNHEPQDDVQQSRRHRLQPYSKHVDEDDGNNPRYNAQERFEYPYMQRSHELQENVQQSRRYKPHPYSKHVDEDEGNNPHYQAQERFDSPAASSRRVPNRLLEQRGDYYREKTNHVQTPNYGNLEDGQFWHSDAAYSEVTRPYSHTVSNHDHSNYTEGNYNLHTDGRQVNQRQRVQDTGVSNSPWPEHLPKQRPDWDRVNSYPAMQQRNRRLPHTMSENDIDHIGKH